MNIIRLQIFEKGELIKSHYLNKELICEVQPNRKFLYLDKVTGESLEFEVADDVSAFSLADCFFASNYLSFHMENGIIKKWE